MTRIKLNHCGSVLSTSHFPSHMTFADIMACTSYMYQVKPLRVALVGPMPSFLFQYFKIRLEVPLSSRPPTSRSHLSEHHRFVTRWSSARCSLRFFHVLRGNPSYENILTAMRLFSRCFPCQRTVLVHRFHPIYLIFREVKPYSLCSRRRIYIIYAL